MTENRGGVQTRAWRGRQPADTMSSCRQTAPVYLFVYRIASPGWQLFKRGRIEWLRMRGRVLSDASVGRATPWTEGYCSSGGRRARDASFEGTDVSGDIRRFGHAYGLASRIRIPGQNHNHARYSSGIPAFTPESCSRTLVGRFLTAHV